MFVRIKKYFSFLHRNDEMLRYRPTNISLSFLTPLKIRTSWPPPWWGMDPQVWTTTLNAYFNTTVTAWVHLFKMKLIQHMGPNKGLGHLTFSPVSLETFRFASMSHLLPSNIRLTPADAFWEKKEKDYEMLSPCLRGCLLGRRVHSKEKQTSLHNVWTEQPHWTTQ